MFSLVDFVLMGFTFFAFLSMLLGFYCLILGNIGWQYFKIRFPLKKNAGTHYFAYLRTGRIKWWYAKFKTEHKWQDGAVTKIVSINDKLHNTREPIIYLIEGYPFNVGFDSIISGRYPDIAKMITAQSKSDYTLGMQRIESNLDAKKGFSGWTPLILMLMVGISLFVMGAIYVQFNDFQTKISPILDQFDANTIQKLKNPVYNPREVIVKPIEVIK